MSHGLVLKNITEQERDYPRAFPFPLLFKLAIFSCLTMTSGEVEYDEVQKASETTCMCCHPSASGRCPSKSALARASERRLSKLEWTSYNCWADLVAKSLSKLELVTQVTSKTDFSISQCSTRLLLTQKLGSCL